MSQPNQAEVLAQRLRMWFSPTMGDDEDLVALEAADLLDRYAELERAARELDELKRLREKIDARDGTIGELCYDDLEYERRKPLAWTDLRAALAQLESK